MEFLSELPFSIRNLSNLCEEEQTAKAHSYMNENHTQLDFTCLSKIYSNQLLSDVILVAEGREIPTHKLILALSSTYFYLKFSKHRNMKVSNRIEIENVSYETLSAIVNYLYNSQILITKDNIEDLLSATDIFVLRDLKKACIDFLKNNISPRFYTRIVNIAKNFRCQDLIEIASNYIVTHFSDVIDHNDYLEMTYEELMDLISHEALIPTEVLECVISWVKYDLQQRKECVYSLIKLVRSSSISKMHILERLVQEQWFVSNPGFYSVLGKILASYVLEGHTPFSVIPTQSEFLVVAGCINDHISIELYDIHNNVWLDWTEGLKIKCNGLSKIATFGSKIYYITDHQMRFIDIKNPAKIIQSDCGYLFDVRKFPSMIVMNNSVYVIGGHHQNRCLATAERFDLISGKMKRIPNMKKSQYGAGLAVLNGTLFAVGGTSDTGCVNNSVQYYKPDTNAWYIMENMSIDRSDSGVAVLGDNLYVVGGIDGDEECNQVEMYNPAEFSWRRLPDMTIARQAPGVIAVHGQLYVIGGYNWDYEAINSIEVYDPKSNTWSMLSTSMKIGKCYVSASLVNKEDINF